MIKRLQTQSQTFGFWTASVELQTTRPEVSGFKQRRIIGDEELAKEHGPWAEHAMSFLSTCLLTTTTPSTVAPTKTRWPAVRNLSQAQQGFLHPTPDRGRGLPAP